MNSTRILHGVYGGLAGGLIFGVMMGMMGMLPMIARMAGSSSPAIGFGIHLIISAVIGCPYRPVAHVLGELALALGRADEARDHLDLALDLARRCGNPWWIADIEADLARGAVR